MNMNDEQAKALASKINAFFDRPGMKKASELVTHLRDSDGVQFWSVEDDEFWLHGEDDAHPPIKTACLGKGLNLACLIERGLILDAEEADPGASTSGGNGSERQIEAAPKFLLSEAQTAHQERRQMALLAAEDLPGVTEKISEYETFARDATFKLSKAKSAAQINQAKRDLPELLRQKQAARGVFSALETRAKKTPKWLRWLLHIDLKLDAAKAHLDAQEEKRVQAEELSKLQSAEDIEDYLKQNAALLRKAETKLKTINVAMAAGELAPQEALQAPPSTTESKEVLAARARRTQSGVVIMAPTTPGSGQHVQPKGVTGT